VSGCRVGRSGSGFAAVTCGGPGVALTRYPCTFPDCHGCSRRMIPYGSSVVVGDKGPGDWLPSLVVMPDGGGHRQDAPPIGPRSRPLPGGTQRWRVPAHSRPHDHPVCRRPARQGAGQAAPVQMERPAGRTIWTGAGWSAGLPPRFHPSGGAGGGVLASPGSRADGMISHRLPPGPWLSASSRSRSAPAGGIWLTL